MLPTTLSPYYKSTPANVSEPAAKVNYHEIPPPLENHATELISSLYTLILNETLKNFENCSLLGFQKTSFNADISPEIDRIHQNLNEFKHDLYTNLSNKNSNTLRNEVESLKKILKKQVLWYLQKKKKSSRYVYQQKEMMKS